ncbi:4-hydroxybenzoate octaprenyltransferase [Idiomarina abyssalis]|jgi:4-hydroxybenzoate polyprenyltransferase|uniref:4-hydroxybenzoate octaprenyltransferase n=2 Tax=Idiomarina TaxID=135575 RepID=UPI001C97A388|nr:4-hydroxybenzoate octaprenyltransferase [Idiomarina abyssalis]MDA6067611.1 4-hydroxybenzoate octaprenyltransferase [Idiomarina abyssalis]QZN91182.1 4-hydroxybenzoate octaprenyltransferase [Idiomarina abyssalis]|tara:strand:- start:3802 stop:4653 length:852 start_codon:yes stop_codon:yes gene_type:complete
MQKLAAFWQLMRADRPIGTYLLAWPTIWALMIAGAGNPPMRIVVIFLLGTFVMRSAGCVINDFADRNFDGHVRRTRQRPIPAGKISATEAMIGFIALLAIAFGLVMQLNTQTVMLSFFAAGVAALYPFCKRWTHLPQVVLGIAFSFGILMAFTALESEQWLIAGLLFLTNVIWTVAYDTEYAMADREDDLKIGLQSTAILFGRFDRLAIGLMQLVSLALLAWVLYLLSAEIWAWLGLAVVLLLFGYQHWLIRHREPGKCFQAFLHNHYVGMVFAIGLALHYWF